MNETATAAALTTNPFNADLKDSTGTTRGTLTTTPGKGTFWHLTDLTSGHCTDPEFSRSDALKNANAAWALFNA